LALALLLSRTRIGLVMQAALTHPDAVQALGHDVPRLYSWVFGAGAALAGLAGVIGGSTFVTEPAMAGAMGSILFVVVVVGGLGSLSGALLACLLIGLLQTLAVTFDAPLVSWLPGVPARSWAPALQRLSLSQVAPLLPYLLMVLVLLLRPRGLLGQRDA
ncbi:MAG: branched-chain amino acid ABC transporter permease, partial [Rhodoferax sp.]|nr:branched-chain amino acid ABC transporter permease [Rhodoferax sp.]